jgi:hypothetical protein
MMTSEAHAVLARGNPPERDHQAEAETVFMLVAVVGLPECAAPRAT